LALFLALSGGAVWAAGKITSNQIGKGAVKNKNLAKSSVKAKNLAKKAVTAPKLANGAVKNAAIADGAVNFAKLAAGTNVVASATAGPVPANQGNLTTLALNPPITVTPVAGQPLTANFEARGTLSRSGEKDCTVTLLPTLNGNPLTVGELLSLQAPENPPDPLFPNGTPMSSVSFPIGLGQPGAPQSIGLMMVGGENCTAGSKVDQVVVVVTQEK
jgi:hypothetical protein